jgi:ATP adenylyltransferase
VERLYTPWRRAFIESSTEASGDGCFLCNALAADPSQDREQLVLFRGERAFVLMNKYPYNSGHLLIAPNHHLHDFARLDADTLLDLSLLTQRGVGVLERVYQPDAFNVGMNLGRAAGAGLPEHLHAHVVPRWNGDTNFMPIVADTKVLPETLEQTYDRLAPAMLSYSRA